MAYRRQREPRLTQDHAPAAVPGARWIPLRNGTWTLVDEDNYDRFKDIAWNTTNGHVFASLGYETCYMSRAVMNDTLLPSGTRVSRRRQIRHINGDNMDNRRQNLEFRKTKAELADEAQKAAA